MNLTPPPHKCLAAEWDSSRFLHWIICVTTKMRFLTVRTRFWFEGHAAEGVSQTTVRSFTGGLDFFRVWCVIWGNLCFSSEYNLSTIFSSQLLGNTQVTAAASFFRKTLFDWSEEGQDMLICTIKNNFRICQQVKGSSSLPLLCSAEATSEVLGPHLGSSVPERRGTSRESPAEGYKNGEGFGGLPSWGKAETWDCSLRRKEDWQGILPMFIFFWAYFTATCWTSSCIGHLRAEWWDLNLVMGKLGAGFSPRLMSLCEAVFSHY